MEISVETPKSNCCNKPIGRREDGKLFCGGSNYEGGCGELCDLAPYKNNCKECIKLGRDCDALKNQKEQARRVWIEMEKEKKL